MPLEILFLLFFYSAITYPLLTKSLFAIRCMFTSFIFINISFCILVYIPIIQAWHFSCLRLILFKSKLIHQSGFLFSEMAKRKRQHHIMCGWYHFPVFFSMSWICDKKPLFTMQMYGRQNAYLKHMAAIRIRMMLSCGFVFLHGSDACTVVCSRFPIRFFFHSSLLLPSLLYTWISEVFRSYVYFHMFISNLYL